MRRKSKKQIAEEHEAELAAMPIEARQAAITISFFGAGQRAPTPTKVYGVWDAQAGKWASKFYTRTGSARSAVTFRNKNENLHVIELDVIPRQRLEHKKDGK